ncbi:hypothetical protein DIS24_g7138 [Lasiodiplodia hormozganensis]|uniref:BTB domain-containing protein n=1 Tax=Lasiodiplodia hormozganensis TaxID=869390 RepID=A0AA39YEM3_9PEZI|nr:hypothetical protein DIS24_g7138 [Lasiodiplodia hormozganensis]
MSMYGASSPRTKKRCLRPPSPPPLETVYFAPDGDTRLFLTSPDTSDKERPYIIFVVSSQVMELMSDEFKPWLKRRACYTEPNAVTSAQPILMPDDDARGMEVLMNIAHLHFYRVPAQLELERLSAVAQVAHAYRATKLLRPWWRGWWDAVKSKALMPGCEEVLYVAWAFGEEETFREIVDRLILTVKLNYDEECVTPDEIVVSSSKEEGKRFPPNIQGLIHHGRSTALERLLQACYELVDEYLTANEQRTFCCKNKSHQNACDSVALGSLILSLQEAELWPERKTHEDINWSVSELLAKMQDFKVTFPEGHSETCGMILARFNTFLNDFIQSERYRVTLDSEDTKDWKIQIDRKKAELTGNRDESSKRGSGYASDGSPTLHW